MAIQLDVGDISLPSNGVSAAQGAVPITNGAQSVSFLFTAALISINSSLVFSFNNTVDSQPIFLQGIVTAFSVSGATVSFNAPVDSSNYTLSYIVVRNL